MDDEGEAMRLVHLVRTAAMDLNVRTAQFARINGLHATDVRALIYLLDAARSGVPATPGLLSGQLGMNSAATTAVIDRLERAGHVRRNRDDPDRRRVRLTVSAEAVELGWSFFGPLIHGLVTAMESFTQAELQTVSRFLCTVTELTAAEPRYPRPQAPKVPHREPPSSGRRPVRGRAIHGRDEGGDGECESPPDGHGGSVSQTGRSGWRFGVCE